MGIFLEYLLLVLYYHQHLQRTLAPARRRHGAGVRLVRGLVGVEHPRRQQLEGEPGQPGAVQGVEQRDCRDVGVEEGGREAGPPVGEGLPESLRGENTRIGRSLQHENHLHARKGGGGRRPSPAAQEGAGGEPSPSRR